MKQLLETLRAFIGRHLKMATYVVLLLVCIALLVVLARHSSLDTYVTPPNVGNPTSSPAVAYTLPRSEPSRLRIPKLTIDAPFTAPLGLKENGEVEVPKGFEEVGWYKYGPTPGSLGPAVIFGHVDSYQGAAIFYHLGQLAPGDSVFVDREDGTTAEFEVTALERYPQSDFPTQKVYGNLDYAGLRLITCSGTYDHDSQRYDRNLVVYAVLKEEATTTSAQQ